MSKATILMISSLLLLGGMLWILARSDAGPARAPRSAGARSGEASGDEAAVDKNSVFLFCAASNQAVMEDVRRAYEKETGRRVMIQYGPSQTLLSQIEVSGAGDLFLPADDSYLDQARGKELVEEVLPIARMQGVVVVRKGNPKRIDAFEDLLADNVRVVQGSHEATAIGSLTKKVLSQAGLWDALDRATMAYRTTVNDVANDILVGAADAGIVYDAVLHPYPDLEYIELQELANVNSQVSVGIVSTTKQPAAALHFARYLSAVDRGLEHYSNYGFRPNGTDQWKDVPELSVYAGSMLRPAIEETIVEFEEREGVRVSRVYNGCGILVAQMKAGQHPDAYFACDMEFMKEVSDLFPEPVSVSENELVILVQKGNPHNIASLKDLTKEGLRVGIGHEKQCAMGWITQNTFREGGVQKEIMANVTVQTPTGDMLVNQLRTGSLDAAVAYLSNAAGSAEFLDAVQIQGIPCSVATQPWAVARQSRFPALAGRLFEKICSAESREAFAAEGFRWQLQSKVSQRSRSRDKQVTK
jgi:molybdate transport system substrate-binding protein